MSVTDNEAPQETRACASRKTKGMGEGRPSETASIEAVALEDAALATANREREKSEGLAYVSTVAARDAQRLFSLHSGYRFELAPPGEDARRIADHPMRLQGVVEIPLVRADKRRALKSWNEVPKPRKSRRKVKTALPARVCACGCGESFVPSRSDAVLAHDGCKQRAYRLRKAAGQAA